jgi:hypothetical protein
MSGSRLKGRYIDLCTPANTKGILFGISDGEALQEEYFERDQEVSELTSLCDWRCSAYLQLPYILPCLRYPRLSDPIYLHDLRLSNASSIVTLSFQSHINTQPNHRFSPKPLCSNSRSILVQQRSRFATLPSVSSSKVRVDTIMCENE